MWTVTYELLSNTDKNTLETFERRVNYGSDSFSWTNPQDGITYEVKFAEPLIFDITFKPELWNCKFQVKEAYPNSSNNLLVQTVTAANFDISTSEITLVGKILSTGNQADASNIYAYFQYGSDVSVPNYTIFSDVISVSDIKLNSKPRTFAIASDILHSGKPLFYRAVLSAENGATLGYGVIESIPSEILGYE
jgi:hypothetical protein